MALVRTQEASFSNSRCTYQVFLSFRGVDTRDTFTSHLYTALMQAGFHTFRDDDEIESGNNIKSELEKAIQQSRISIIVFSKNYASSRWCLDELLMILECQRTSKHVVLPVFYHVDPSQVRHQLGSIGEAFDRYKEKLETETNDERKKEFKDKLRRWKEALKEAANLSGINQDNGNESEFVKKIVIEVQQKLNRTVLLDEGRYLVGIHDRTKKIDLWLRDGSSNVNIMMICGMGGIGKTTIAKFVFNKNFKNFDGYSFLEDINEQSKQPQGFIGLQNQLLSDICKRKKEDITNTHKGITMIRDALCCKKVLLVLDDVDEGNQLYKILGMSDWSFPRSKIIITSRREQLRTTAKMTCEVYKVETLSFDESFKLFSFHAFKQSQPTKNYINIMRAVNYCEGLPLALEVWACYLSTQNFDLWGNALKKLESIPDGEILNKLKLSFQSLPDHHDKNLFLHIACFFVGKDKDWTEKILKACGFYPRVGINNLVNQHLLTIKNDNRLMMHNLIRDMGREIVKKESSSNPGKRSRLWHYEDCLSILRDKTGSNSIEAFVYDMQTSSRVHSNGSSSNHVDFKTEAFDRMQQIKFLQLNYIKLTGGYKKFPKGLRWLCWHGFHSNFMPNDFPLGNLIGLDLQYSSLKGVMMTLPCLKTLNLSHSKWLEGTPKFSQVPNLKRLFLKGCVRLVKVCESIESAQRLTVLDLENCKKLKKLPGNFGLQKNLKKLIISGCSSLCEFPMGLRNLDSLEEFRADGVNMNPTLALTRVGQQRPSLPQFLSELSLVRCNLSNHSFPHNFNNLSSLIRLDLSENLIESLPDCIRSLSELKYLALEGCPQLQSIVGLPNNVIGILASLNPSLKKVGTTPKLLRMNIYWCRELVEVETLFKFVPFINCDRKILEKLGLLDVVLRTSKCIDEFDDALKVVYEYDIFSTTVPGCLPPTGYNYVSTPPHNLYSFIVPSLPNIRGLNVCVVYRGGWGSCCTPVIKMHNETKDFSWLYSPNFRVLDYDEQEEYFMMLSHWKSGNALQGGDKVTVSVILYGKIYPEVEKIGIKVVYDDDDDDDDEDTEMSCKSSNIYLSWTEQNTLRKLSDFQETGISYYLDSSVTISLFFPLWLNRDPKGILKSEAARTNRLLVRRHCVRNPVTNSRVKWDAFRYLDHDGPCSHLDKNILYF